MEHRPDSSHYFSPETDILRSHPVEYTPSVSPASTRAGSPNTSPVRLMSSGKQPVGYQGNSNGTDLAPRSLQGDMEATTPTQAESDAVSLFSDQCLFLAA